MTKIPLDARLKGVMGKQFDKIASLHRKKRFLPISYSQVFFWALCLVDNHPKNEITGRYLWGELDLDQLTASYNQVLQEHDIFHFRFHKYLPLAKLKKPASQSIVRFDLSDMTAEQQTEEIKRICIDLEKCDLRFETVCHSVIVKLNDYKYLMLTAFAHTLIDTTSKNLFWQYLLNNLPQNTKSSAQIPSYLDYIAVERAFHYAHLPQYKSMLDVHHEEVPVAQFQGALFDANEHHKIKERHFIRINRELVSHLKSYAQQRKMSLETLLMSIFLKSISKFMSNETALVQNINVGVYPELFDTTCGPHLQESILIIDKLKKASLEVIAAGVKEQIWSQPFHSLPFSFGLGLILDNHLTSLSSGENLLFKFLSALNPVFFRKLLIPNDILMAYRGLIKFDNYNKNNSDKLIILNFNFRYDLSQDALMPAAKPHIYAEQSFIHPFYTKPNDYLVFNFDRDEDDSILFHMESPFSDTTNSEIAMECLRNTEKTR